MNDVLNQYGNEEKIKITELEYLPTRVPWIAMSL